MTVRRLRWILERVIACCGSILVCADIIWPQTKRKKDTEKGPVIPLDFLSSLVEQELTFLALAAVSKQKAAMWWVWLAADGGEISGRAVRWMPSWPACDVQFVARASLGRKALKILLAVTQRKMWCCFAKKKKKKLFPNTPLFSITSFHSARKNINFIVVIKKCMQVACK